VIFLCCVKCLGNFPGAVLAAVLNVVFKLIALAHELLQPYQDGDPNEWKESRIPETGWCASNSETSLQLYLFILKLA